MLHGKLHCETCGYEGPHFMWMPHHGMDHGALVQNLNSLDLRVARIPEFRQSRDIPSDEQGRRFEEHVTSVVESQLEPHERHVPLTEFVRFREGKPLTDLPCPRCLQRLLWRHTGIS